MNNRPPILGSKNVTPEMQFRCEDCSDIYTGKDVLENRIRMHIVTVNLQNPITSVFRCELCQEDVDEREDY